MESQDRRRKYERSQPCWGSQGSRPNKGAYPRRPWDCPGDEYSRRSIRNMESRKDSRTADTANVLIFKGMIVRLLQVTLDVNLP